MAFFHQIFIDVVIQHSQRDEKEINHCLKETEDNDHQCTLYLKS